jgi:hypothetical protein
VAEARSLDVEWRPFSLLVLNGGPDDEHGDELIVTHRALRLVEHLNWEGRQADIARFYTAFGQLAHEEGFAVDDDLVASAVRAADLGAEGATLDDPGLDDGIRLSTEAAVAAAGPGVGSPVMLFRGAERGFHGPVIKAVPDKREALAMWDAIEALAPIEGFFEIKRGRT